MTKNSLLDTAALRALLSETSDSNLLAEMLGFVADRLMALDVDQLGAELGDPVADFAAVQLEGGLARALTADTAALAIGLTHTGAQARDDVGEARDLDL